MLTRSLLNIANNVVDYSAKIGVVDVDDRVADLKLFSNPLPFHPTHVVYSEPFRFIGDCRDFTKLRSYLLIIELFAEKCNINRLLHQRSIKKFQLPRRPAYGYYAYERLDDEIGPVDFLLPQFPYVSEFSVIQTAPFGVLSLEEQKNIVRENYRMYTRNGLNNSSLNFAYWGHIDYFFRCIICQAIDGSYSSISAILGFRFLKQLLVIGFRDLIKSLLGCSRRVVIAKINLLPNAERQPNMSLQFDRFPGAPRFTAIDWERCLLLNGFVLFCPPFSHFLLLAFDVKDEFKAPIESLLSEVQQLVDAYESPLTLQQLARLAVRKRLSGPQFETRVRSLPLSPRHLDFLLFAEELLLSV